MKPIKNLLSLFDILHSLGLELKIGLRIENVSFEGFLKTVHIALALLEAI